MSFQIVGVVVVLVVLGGARASGAVWSALHAYLLLSALVIVVWRAIDLIKGRISLIAYRQPTKHSPQLAAIVVRVVVWLLLAVAVDVAMPAEEFRYRGESRLESWLAASVLMAMALLPRQRRWAPGDVLFGVLLVVVGVDLARVIELRPENALDIRPPFDDASYVRNGGTSLLVNDHARFLGEQWAIDLYPFTDGGALCEGETLDSFPCFGASVLAPVQGRVAYVQSDRPDMPLGEPDQEVETGNSVSIQTEDGRYLVLGHLKQSTILVKEGDTVTVGQELARCGNSGEASVPHLFLQAQDRPVALRGHSPPRTFPLRFVDAWRERGDDFTVEPFVVRRNDVLGPIVDEGEDPAPDE